MEGLFPVLRRGLQCSTWAQGSGPGPVDGQSQRGHGAHAPARPAIPLRCLLPSAVAPAPGDPAVPTAAERGGVCSPGTVRGVLDIFGEAPAGNSGPPTEAGGGRSRFVLRPRSTEGPAVESSLPVEGASSQGSRGPVTCAFPLVLSPQSERASEEAGEGDYVGLCGSGRSGGALAGPRGVSDLGCFAHAAWWVSLLLLAEPPGHQQPRWRRPWLALQQWGAPPAWPRGRLEIPGAAWHRPWLRIWLLWVLSCYPIFWCRGPSSVPPQRRGLFVLSLPDRSPSSPACSSHPPVPAPREAGEPAGPPPTRSLVRPSRRSTCSSWVKWSAFLAVLWQNLSAQNPQNSPSRL